MSGWIAYFNMLSGVLRDSVLVSTVFMTAALTVAIQVGQSKEKVARLVVHTIWLSVFALIVSTLYDILMLMSLDMVLIPVMRQRIVDPTYGDTGGFRANEGRVDLVLELGLGFLAAGIFLFFLAAVYLWLKSHTSERTALIGAPLAVLIVTIFVIATMYMYVTIQFQ